MVARPFLLVNSTPKPKPCKFRSVSALASSLLKTKGLSYLFENKQLAKLLKTKALKN
jgi:hypothetical protein